MVMFGHTGPHGAKSFNLLMIKRLVDHSWLCMPDRSKIDTVGVWGSNPHAPTISINKLAQLTALSVTPFYSIGAHATSRLNTLVADKSFIKAVPSRRSSFRPARTLNSRERYNSPAEGAKN